MLRFANLFHPAVIFLLWLGGLLWVRCTPKEEIIDFDFSGGLVFSTDTIMFDTVFSGAGTATKRLIIYNPHQKALQISNITLGGGVSSPYEVDVNGAAAGQATLLLGKDSALVLIKVFIDPQDQDAPYLVNDSLIFETNGHEQQVKLVAWGQDANYLGNEVLPCNTTWTSNRPYVLYAPVLVDSLCTLTIDAGVSVFCTKNTYLYVKGNIHANGAAGDRIIFKNDRTEPIYENIPGQWGGLVFLQGSHGNLMHFVTLRNAQVGIRLGSPDQDTIPDVVLKNVIIENMDDSGILAFTSDLLAENVLIDNCQILNIGNLAGGNYIYRHCTMANFGFNFIRETPSVFLSDHITLADQSSIVEDLHVEFTNCIVDGSMENEVFFDLTGETNTTLSFVHNILKTNINALDTLGNRLNVDPKFVDPGRYNYRLDTLSPAKDAGVPIGILTDLDDNFRDSIPDIGAYERIE